MHLPGDQRACPKDQGHRCLDGRDVTHYDQITTLLAGRAVFAKCLIQSIAHSVLEVEERFTTFGAKPGIREELLPQRCWYFGEGRAVMDTKIDLDKSIIN